MNFENDVSSEFMKIKKTARKKMNIRMGSFDLDNIKTKFNLNNQDFLILRKHTNSEDYQLCNNLFWMQSQ